MAVNRERKMKKFEAMTLSIDGTIESAIKELERARELYGASAEISFHTAPYEDTPRNYVLGMRLETDEEYDYRIKFEEREEARQLVLARSEYERLKKIFGE